MAHRFKITKTAKGYMAKFVYNAETIFWTETYTTKESARNAIASIQKNGPGAEVVDETD
jgi:uncharacterized protein YegP (UPF0339 family)